MAEPTPRRGLPRVLRVLLLVVLAAAVLVLLFGWVFPWVETNIYNPSLDETAPVPARLTA